MQNIFVKLVSSVCDGNNKMMVVRDVTDAWQYLEWKVEQWEMMPTTVWRFEICYNVSQIVNTLRACNGFQIGAL